MQKFLVQAVKTNCLNHERQNLSKKELIHLYEQLKKQNKH